MPRRSAVPVLLALCCAAVPSVALADTGPCQGAGTITDRGGHDVVNAGGSAVVGGDFTSTDRTPDGLLFRLQVVGVPTDMSAVPSVSWRIDGGPWHGAGLSPDRGLQGDPYWVTASTSIGRLTPGTHRAEVSLTPPAGSAGRIFSLIGYFDTAAPCSQLAGDVSINGVAVTGSGGGGGPATTPSPTRHPSASPTHTATPGPSASSAESSPSDSPTPTPTPTPSPTPSPSASPSDLPSPSPSTSPTQLSAAHTGSGAGLLWAATALIVGATAAVGAIAYRRRSAHAASE